MSTLFLRYQQSCLEQHFFHGITYRFSTRMRRNIKSYKSVPFPYAHMRYIAASEVGFACLPVHICARERKNDAMSKKLDWAWKQDLSLRRRE